MVLSAKGLRKRFGKGAAAVTAVDGVSLELHAGEVMMIMGPSGSGKTTLLSMLGLLMHPDEGSVRIAGRDVAGLPQRDLVAVRRDSFGFVFQTFLLLPSLTARENVEVAANIAGKRGKEAVAMADDMLIRLGLQHRLHGMPRDMSGGEKQRVAIARALVKRPPILLADEPTGQLDSASGHAVAELLRSTALEVGAGVIIVSHDERIRPLADRVVTMEDGRFTGTLRPGELPPWEREQVQRAAAPAGEAA